MVATARRPIRQDQGRGLVAAAAFHAAAAAAHATAHAATHAHADADTDANAFHHGAGRRALLRRRLALYDNIFGRLLACGDLLLRRRRWFVLDMLPGRQ